MKPLLFLDTETTSLEDGRLIELAYGSDAEDIKVLRVRPPARIDFDAMSTHHITEADVINYPFFKDIPEYETLRTTLKDHIIVAHNAPFDLDILSREGIETDEYIDTLRVAQHLYPAAKMHRLQYLRYYLGCAIEGKTDAHSADGDVRVLMAVFRKIIADTYKQYDVLGDADLLDKLIELTKTPVLLTTISFGKYKGMPFSEVSRTDHKYLLWLLDQKRKEKTPDDSLVHTLRHWIKRRVV